MSDTTSLPPGWRWATVRELLNEKLCNGISIKGSDTPPGTPALKLGATGGNGFDYSDRRYIPIDGDMAESLAIREGDFFVARGNGSLHLVGRGTLAQAPPDQVVFPDTMIRIRLPDTGSLRKYISVLWQSGVIRHQIERRARTTAGIYKVSQQDIEELQLPLAPLAEQRRIVAKVEELFSELDAGAAVLEKVRAKLKQYRASVLKAAVEGRLTEGWRAEHPPTEPAPALLARVLADRRRRWEEAQQAKFATAGKSPPKDWQAKYAEPTPPDAATLPSLPDGWCWAAALQVCERVENRNTPPPAQMTQGSGEVPFIKVYNLTHTGHLNFDHKPTFISTETHRNLLGRSVVRPGDVLMNIVGPPLGKVSLVHRRDAARPGRHPLRPGLRDRRVPPGRAPVRPRPPRNGTRRRPEAAREAGVRQGGRTGPEHGPAVHHEPVPARDRRRPVPGRVRDRRPGGPAERAVLPGDDQPAVRPEVEHRHRGRRRRPGEGGHRLRAAGLLDHDEEQAGELPPARQEPAEGERPVRRGAAGQRAVRGRGRGDGAAGAAGAGRRTHPAAAADRPVLRAGGQANVLFFDAKPVREQPWTTNLWVYDLRTNRHFTLKTKPLKRADLDEFVACYRRGERHLRKATWSEENPQGRWRRYGYDELVRRDKLNLDLFWLKDESLEDLERLPEPDVLADEILEDLQTAVELFGTVAKGLKS